MAKAKMTKTKKQTEMSKKKVIKKYLVVSVDTDQQQWFYDFVLAESAKAATEFVCKNRDYVQEADATEARDLASMSNSLSTWPVSGKCPEGEAVFIS